MMFGISRRIRIGASALAIGLSLAAAAQAQERAYSRPAEPLSVRLREFARVSGEQIVFTDDLVRGKTAPAFQGSYAADEALGRILAGTGLVAHRSESGAIMIVRADVPQDPAALNGGATQLDEVVVTGTRIRGGTTPSPVISIGAAQMREEGFADLGEVIRSVPQNFSGGQNPGVVNGAASSLSNQNLTGGSGLNLRGLGPDATLTLLNGRRLSYGGFVQAVDISAIPVGAVERLEILPDGASAIYGSDAVGGVGNVVLKRDYDGLTVGARYGGATDGGLETREYNITGGAKWNSGGLIATYLDVSSDPVYANDRSYTDNLYDPYTIYSGGALKSGLASLHQRIGGSLEFRLDALRTERERTHYEGYSSFYALATPKTTTLLIAPTLDIALPNDWSLSVGGAWGEDETRYSTQIVFSSSISVGETFYGNESRAYEAGAEGPLFSLPGGDARLAVGGGYRENAFLQRNNVSGVVSVDADEGSRFAYAEINLPLIGAEQSLAGVRRLVLTGAVRAEDYDSFGSVTTPKFGLVYEPSADVTVKTSWGRSFKAPTLNQLGQARTAYLYSASYMGGSGYPSDATVLMTYGGNPDLGPEEAETWSATLAFHPRSLSGLEVELTAYDIEYKDRVVLPLSITQALSNPIYAQFIDYAPTASDLAAILAGYTFYNYAGAAYDASKVIAVANDQYTNVSRQTIRGLDLSGSYRFDFDTAHLTLRGSLGWLESSQQLTSAQAAYDLSGTLFNPAKVKGRIGAVWNDGGFTASAFVNHTDGVTDTLTGNGSGSFTTLDATLRYETGEDAGAFSGLRFELSGQNLFDEAPPSYMPTSATAVRYDSTNYSAIGRFLSLSVAKHW